MSKKRYPTHFGAMFGHIWQYRSLVWLMTKREVIGRYRGSMMGILWSLVNPIIMLAVYTLVFGFVFHPQWPESQVGKADFAVIIFSGLIIFTFFSEFITRAPNVLISNINFVKRVVFPLEIFPCVTIGGILFHILIQFAVLLVFYFLIHFYLHWTIVFIPIIIMPLIFFALGLGWFLTSMGVFIRDTGYAMQILSMVMMFLSPIFYPVSAIPETFRALLYMNPLVFVIEQFREVVIWGRMPNFFGLTVFSCLSLFVAWLGFYWFQTTRKGFADII